MSASVKSGLLQQYRPIADIPYGSPWRYRPRMTFRRAIFLLAIGVAIGVIVALGGR